MNHAPIDSRGYPLPSSTWPMHAFDEKPLTVRQRVDAALTDLIDSLVLASESPDLDADKDEDLNLLLECSVLRKQAQKLRLAVRK